MKKTLSLAAFALAAAIAAPAVAEEAPAPQKSQFTYEGVTYIYTKKQVGESTIYKGTATPGSEFYLVERNGHVTGKANGINVSFDLDDKEYLAAYNKPVRLASR